MCHKKTTLEFDEMDEENDALNLTDNNSVENTKAPMHQSTTEGALEDRMKNDRMDDKIHLQGIII